MSAPRDPLRRLVRWYSAKSFVYVIGSDAAVKIGRSIDPQRRYGQLQQSSPVPLTIYAIVPEFVVSEERAHEMWAHLRQHGEWFQRSPELDAWLDGLSRLYLSRLAARERVMGILERRKSGIRTRLGRLSRVEANMASARQRTDLAALRESQTAAPCRLCGRTGMSRYRSAHLAGVLCQGCSNWLGKIASQGASTVRVELLESLHRARQKLAAHDLRNMRLAEIMRSAATQRGEAVFSWMPGVDSDTAPSRHPGGVAILAPERGARHSSVGENTGTPGGGTAIASAAEVRS